MLVASSSSWNKNLLWLLWSDLFTSFKFASLVLYFIQFTGLMGNTCTFLFLWKQAGCELVNCSSLPSPGIKGMYHLAWLPYIYIVMGGGRGCLFLIRSLAVQAGLKLAMSQRMIPNSRSSCLYFLSAGITGMWQHILFMQCWGWNHTPNPSSYRLLRVAHSGTQKMALWQACCLECLSQHCHSSDKISLPGGWQDELD